MVTKRFLHLNPFLFSLLVFTATFGIVGWYLLKPVSSEIARS
jgi:hypothetical protein